MAGQAHSHGQTGQQDIAVGSDWRSRFQGHYHQHVQQNCEGACDDVDDDSDVVCWISGFNRPAPLVFMYFHLNFSRA